MTWSTSRSWAPCGSPRRPSRATLPTTKTTLTQGKTYSFAVTVTNNSAQQQLYFADPRLDQNTEYNLASQTPGDDLQNVTLPNPANLPQWLVPTSTSAVNFTANATLPVGLDVGVDLRRSGGLRLAAGQLGVGEYQRQSGGRQRSVVR